MTWEVRLTADGHVGLFPIGPGFDDPRDRDKPIAKFDADAAVEIAHEILKAAALLRAGNAKE